MGIGSGGSCDTPCILSEISVQANAQSFLRKLEAAQPFLKAVTINFSLCRPLDNVMQYDDHTIVCLSGDKYIKNLDF